MDRASRNGFTLVEMSIVLMIVGLLIAGIIMAQSLVRSSNVQSILQDAAKYQTAVALFKQKYGGLPGDMSNASNYWGLGVANCGAPGTGTLTCNGNNDGVITKTLAAPYEQFLVWQHLANAGLIPGQYSGTASGAAISAPYVCSPGINCPGGSLSGTQAYYLQYTLSTAFSGTTLNWEQPMGHYLVVGTRSSSGWPALPLLSAPEAYSLDSKVDDGLPGMGIWKTFQANGAATYTPNCVVVSGSTTAPASGVIANQATAVYYVGYGSALACSLTVQMNF